MGAPIYGLLGRKLGHSYSVPIHAAFGNSSYRLIELEPEQLGPFLQQPEVAGLNVTIPYKKDVIPFMDELTPAARAMGSVNTVYRNENGGLVGDNTDAYGLTNTLENAGICLKGEKVLILGSGGASNAARYVAAQQGARQTVIISRSGEDNYGNLYRHRDAGVIINATPVGMYPNTDASPLDLTLFPGLKGVADMIYNPLRTRLLEQAAALNIPHVGGLRMLVAQAQPASCHFGFPVSHELREKVLAGLRSQTENAVLVGMPGCGKSTVGSALAKLSGRELVDADEELVKRAGCSIPEIFAKQGEDAFRRLESEVLADLGKRHGIILCTGGGAVTRPENDFSLRQNGRVYFVRRPIGLLARAGRPLSRGADLNAMYEKRLPMYLRVSDVCVDNTGTPAETAAAIWNDLTKGNS